MRRSTCLFAAVLAAAALLPASCSKNAETTLFDKQEKIIETFVNARLEESSKGRLTRNDGVFRVTLKEGTGDTLSRDGVVSFYYAGYTLPTAAISASNLFWTNHKATATASGWALTDTTVFHAETLKLGEDDLLEGLGKGLTGVRRGEECYIVFSGKHGFGMRLHGTISAKSALAYHIWVESISNE